MEQCPVSFYTQLSFISSGKKMKKNKGQRKITNMFFFEKENTQVKFQAKLQHLDGEGMLDLWYKMASVRTIANIHELIIKSF